MCANAHPHALLCALGFHTRWIDGVGCGLFSIHAPLGLTTLHVGQVLYSVLMEVEVRVIVCVSVCVV